MLKRRVLMYCIALSLCSVLKPQTVFAETLFEDNFDDGVLDNWTVVRNFSWNNMNLPCYDHGQPAVWQILLQRLGITIDGQGCFTEIIPTTFKIPPNQGYVFEFDMTMPESTHMNRGYTLRYLNESHAYAVVIMDHQIYVAKGMAAVSPIPNAIGNFPFEVGGTYRMRNEFGVDNSIKIFINDTLVINTFDIAPFFTGGTIGFQGSVGAIPTSEVWFDNVKVSTLTDPRDLALDVPYYSQRDPLWASEIYDSADEWSGMEQNSIERWGCALTAAVMVLKYHNITEIDSTTITPSTLNNWLNSQQDGYIGDGLVNWIALTRLSKQFNTVNPNTPSLEFTFAHISSNKARQKMEEQQPFIVSLPNHFVVARGIKHIDNTLLVHDPLDHHKTSLPNTTQYSTRLFTPSFTDLSYILAVHDTDITAEIENTDGNIVSSFVESIEDDVGSEMVTGSVIHQLAKPLEGIYTLTIQSSSTPTYAIDLYFYDEEGEVQYVEVNGSSSHLPVQYTIAFAKDAETVVTRLQSRFITALQASYQNHEISSAYVYYSILKIAQYREATTNEIDDARYKKYLRQLLETHAHTFSPVTLEGLDALL